MTLNDFMEREGWTINRLAEMTGLTHEGARLICNGKRRPSPKVAQDIARATGGLVTVADLRPDLAAAMQAPEIATEAAARPAAPPADEAA